MAQKEVIKYLKIVFYSFWLQVEAETFWVIYIF